MFRTLMLKLEKSRGGDDSIDALDRRWGRIRFKARYKGRASRRFDIYRASWSSEGSHREDVCFHKELHHYEGQTVLMSHRKGFGVRDGARKNVTFNVRTSFFLVQESIRGCHVQV